MLELRGGRHVRPTDTESTDVQTGVGAPYGGRPLVEITLVVNTDRRSPDTGFSGRVGPARRETSLGPTGSTEHRGEGV